MKQYLKYENLRIRLIRQMSKSWFNTGLTIIIDPLVLQVVSEEVFRPYQPVSEGVWRSRVW